MITGAFGLCLGQSAKKGSRAHPDCVLGRPNLVRLHLGRPPLDNSIGQPACPRRLTAKRITLATTDTSQGTLISPAAVMSIFRGNWMIFEPKYKLIDYMGCFCGRALFNIEEKNRSAYQEKSNHTSASRGGNFVSRFRKASCLD